MYITVYMILLVLQSGFVGYNLSGKGTKFTERVPWIILVLIMLLTVLAVHS